MIFSEFEAIYAKKNNGLASFGFYGLSKTLCYYTFWHYHMLNLKQCLNMWYQYHFEGLYMAYKYMIWSSVDCRPSTFAQGAKLKRLATAKEKELANCEAICSFGYLWFVS